MTTPTVTELAATATPSASESSSAATTSARANECIVGQRVNGVVRVSDVPAGGRGRAYLIERELEHDGYDALNALVADYLAQAAQLGDVPMAVSLLERYLDHLGHDHADAESLR